MAQMVDTGPMQVQHIFASDLSNTEMKEEKIPTLKQSACGTNFVNMVFQ